MAVEILSVDAAVAWLRAGGVVAYPTDTFYGLAVDPESTAAVAALFDLKGRGVDSALPFIAADRAGVERRCGGLSRSSARLADAFWPGPLTLVLSAPGSIVPEALAGGDTIAVRVPASPLARELARTFGGLLPATSANRSGAPPAATIAELAELVRDARVRVFAGSPAPGGRPSTIVDARADPPRLVREGAIAWSRVLDSWQA